MAVFSPNNSIHFRILNFDKLVLCLLVFLNKKAMRIANEF